MAGSPVCFSAPGGVCLNVTLPDTLTIAELSQALVEHVHIPVEAQLFLSGTEDSICASRHGNVPAARLFGNSKHVAVVSRTLHAPLSTFNALDNATALAGEDAPSASTSTSSAARAEGGSASSRQSDWPSRIKAKTVAQNTAPNIIPPDAVLAVKKAGLDPMEYNNAAVAVFTRVAEMSGSRYTHGQIWRACHNAGFEFQRALHYLIAGDQGLSSSMSCDSVSSMGTSNASNLASSPVMTLLDRTPTSSVGPRSPYGGDSLLTGNAPGTPDSDAWSESLGRSSGAMHLDSPVRIRGRSLQQDGNQQHSSPTLGTPGRTAPRARRAYNGFESDSDSDGGDYQGPSHSLLGGGPSLLQPSPASTPTLAPRTAPIAVPALTVNNNVIPPPPRSHGSSFQDPTPPSSMNSLSNYIATTNTADRARTRGVDDARRSAMGPAGLHGAHRPFDESRQPVVTTHDADVGDDVNSQSAIPPPVAHAGTRPTLATTAVNTDMATMEQPGATLFGQSPPSDSGATLPNTIPAPSQPSNTDPTTATNDDDGVVGRWVDMPAHGPVNTRVLANIVRDPQVRALLQRPEMIHGLSLYLDQLLHVESLNVSPDDSETAAVLLDEVAHRVGIQDALTHLQAVIDSNTTARDLASRPRRTSQTGDGQ